jgi:hypothetical protein
MVHKPMFCLQNREHSPSDCVSRVRQIGADCVIPRSLDYGDSPSMVSDM